ncbi:MAG: endonuclease/exonuclease/phosphatase family protein [Planctomycetota bacterium]
MVRVVTYNTHLLPAIALPFAGKRSAAAYRSKRIAEELADHDVIGMCEVFDRTSRRKIIETLKAESGDAFYFANGPARSGRHMTNSGLLLCSRFPISAQNEMTYRSASRYITHGFKADSFAAKGALHVRLQVEADLELDCFLTHLESQSPAARMRQVSEFCSFVEQHQNAERPLVILGDFNIAFSEGSDAEPSGEYASLLKQLGELRSTEIQDLDPAPNNGPPGTGDALAEGGGSRIDYILVSAAEPERTSGFIVGQVEHVRLLDEEVPEGSLSDHLAVSCELTFPT